MKTFNHVLEKNGCCFISNNYYVFIISFTTYSANLLPIATHIPPKQKIPYTLFESQRITGNLLLLGAIIPHHLCSVVKEVPGRIIFHTIPRQTNPLRIFAPIEKGPLSSINTLYYGNFSFNFKAYSDL